MHKTLGVRCLQMVKFSANFFSDFSCHFDNHQPVRYFKIILLFFSFSLLHSCSQRFHHTLVMPVHQKKTILGQFQLPLTWNCKHTITSNIRVHFFLLIKYPHNCPQYLPFNLWRQRNISGPMTLTLLLAPTFQEGYRYDRVKKDVQYLLACVSTWFLSLSLSLSLFLSLTHLSTSSRLLFLLFSFSITRTFQQPLSN